MGPPSGRGRRLGVSLRPLPCSVPPVSRRGGSVSVASGCRGMARSSEHFGAFLERSVKVTLKCGVFQGVLQHLGPERSLLLRSVKNLETGRSTPGLKMFFGHEIVSVELLDEPNSGKGAAVPSDEVVLTSDCPVTEMKHVVTSSTRCTSAAEGNKQADTGQAGCGPWNSPCVSLESQLRASNRLKYSPSEKKEEESVEYTVVDCFQQKFGSAILHLKQQSVVSVAGEGVNLCRHGKLSLLEMATKSRIFLFDIFLLGPQAFKNGLQMVLEDKNILKIMHDCRWISDCLFHQYGVLLSNVFDTQVADTLQFSMATGGFLPHRVCSFQECLMQHLKIPSTWLASIKCRQQMASPSCMELPEELRQLAATQKQRQKKAIKEYRMNEDGLLIRPLLELKEKSDPQKDGNCRDDSDGFPTNKAVAQVTSFCIEDLLPQEKLENQNQV
ncbi:piRNA biogenesis protein EXD1 isoform X4 [Heliangelus exortis]|uniref:piRNA biogenesis protein EXD1 isoform X4 n=1 Tax=Heliangelus exortis TaxID=472823 RepID=UPI003A8F6C86